MHAGNVITNDAAKLVILESWAAEDNWEAVGKALADWPDAKGLGFDYYRAVVDGNHDKASQILANGSSPVGIVEAKLYEAGKLAESGDRNAAERLWRAITDDTNSTRRAFAAAAANLMDATLLRRAYNSAMSLHERLSCALTLGQALLKSNETAEEGATLVRSAVRDSPDIEGAIDAFLAIAEADLAAGRWKSAADVYAEAAEIWPKAAKRSSVHDGRGWALMKLGRLEEALTAFTRAEELAKDDYEKAAASLKQADVLSELGRNDEAMMKYRSVVKNYPTAPFAERIRRLVAVRENETKGREHYKNFRFEEARRAFAEVGKEDPAKRPRMDFYEVLCLYGQGADSEAAEKATRLATDCPNAEVRAEVTLWLAKFKYNQRDWKSSARLFITCADSNINTPQEAEALMWAARASLAGNDFTQAISLSTRLVKSHGKSPLKTSALLVQAEALIELARFDEAVLVLDSIIATQGITPSERTKAKTMRADALYAMGPDNPALYNVALEAYREIRFGDNLQPSERLRISFKIARILEKLKRLDEAIDQYYTHVILAYRTGRINHERFSEEARAAYSRAAFRLAEEFESRGRDSQAAAVLQLVAESDVPAASEAAKRLERIYKKGLFQ
jgi:tetratricopeptide (TPR) repeat protein